jgi:hypothetical protein
MATSQNKNACLEVIREFKQAEGFTEETQELVRLNIILNV